MLRSNSWDSLMNKILAKPREALMLSASVAEAVKKEARRRHVTAETFIRTLLEDAADARAGDAALKRHLASGSETVPLSKVKQSLGMDR